MSLWLLNRSNSHYFIQMKSASHGVWTTSWAISQACSWNQFSSLPARSSKYGSNIPHGIIAGLAVWRLKWFTKFTNHDLTHERAAEDFRVKNLMFMGGSKATGHAFYGLLEAHAVHITPKFSKGRTPLKVSYSMLHKAKYMHTIQYNFWLQDQCYLHKI